MGGSLTFTELKNAIDTAGTEQHAKIKNFVETGTYKGDTTMMAAQHFDKVYTIEIHTGLYAESVKRAMTEGRTNISFLLGDSINELNTIAPLVKDGAVFFIDAHISGRDSGWNGKTRVPLLEELKTILKHKVGPRVFIFDDLRLWKNGTWDWAHVSNDGIVQTFAEHGYRVSRSFEHNDRLYVFSV